MAEQGEDKKAPLKKQKNTGTSTSISFSAKNLEKYRNHAKEENLEFSKMIAAMIELDIKEKEECMNDPDRIIQRILTKFERVFVVGIGKDINRVDETEIFEMLLRYNHLKKNQGSGVNEDKLNEMLEKYKTLKRDKKNA